MSQHRVKSALTVARSRAASQPQLRYVFKRLPPLPFSIIDHSPSAAPRLEVGCVSRALGSLRRFACLSLLELGRYPRHRRMRSCLVHLVQFKVRSERASYCSKPRGKEDERGTDNKALRRRKEGWTRLRLRVGAVSGRFVRVSFDLSVILYTYPHTRSKAQIHRPSLSSTTCIRLAPHYTSRYSVRVGVISRAFPITQTLQVHLALLVPIVPLS